MAYFRGSFIIGTASAPGTGNVTLVNSTGLNPTSVPDGATCHYSIQDQPFDGTCEAGLGTKTTSAGSAVLIRTAANVLTGSSGAGHLVSFNNPLQIVQISPLGEVEVLPNVGSDPSVSSLGQEYYRTDLDTIRGVFNTAPANRNLVSDTYYKHTALGSNAKIDDGSTFYPTTTFSSTLALQETSSNVTANNIEGITAYLTYDPQQSATSQNAYAADIEIQTLDTNSQNIGTLNGVFGGVSHNGSGVVTAAYGLNFSAANFGSGSITTAYGSFNNAYNIGTGTVSNIYGLYSAGQNFGTGTAALCYGIFIDAGGSSPITNNYGLWIAAQAGKGTNTYNIWSDGATSANIFVGPIGGGAITAPTAQLHIVKSDSATNAVTQVLKYGHESTGTPAAGFGLGEQVFLDSSTTSQRLAHEWDVVWATATDASRKSRIVGYVQDAVAGAMEWIRAEDDGTQGLVGVGGAVIASTRMTVYSGASTYTGLAVQAAASQSVDLTQWQTSAAKTRARVTSACEYSNPKPNDCTGANNECFGAGAGVAMTSASQCTFLGASAAAAWTVAPDNVVIGYQAAKAAVAGSGTGQNVVIGSQAMLTATGAPIRSVAIGYQAAGSIAASPGDIVAIGRLAGLSCGGNCVMIGSSAGAVASSGPNNSVFIGFQAGQSVTGNQNIIVGFDAGQATLTTGTGNVILGYTADTVAASTSQGVAIGTSARCGTNDLSTGPSINTWTGHQLDSTATDEKVFQIALGFISNTHASWTGKADLKCLDNAGTRTCISLGASGTVAEVSFFGASLVTQQTSTGNTSYADSGAAVVHTAGTFTGGTGSTAYTIGDIVLALKNYGLLAA